MKNKNIKKIFICFLSIVLVFNTFCFSVFASSESTSSPLQSAFSSIQDFKNSASEDNITESIMLGAVRNTLLISGFILNPAVYEAVLPGIIRGAINNYNNKPSDNVPTQEETNNYARHLSNNISLSGSVQVNPTITLNSTSRSEINNIGQGIIDHYGYSYVYSFRLIDSLHNFQNQVVYDAIRRFLSENENNFDVIFLASDNGQNPNLYAFDFDNIAFVQSSDNTNYASIYANLYDFGSKLVFYLDNTNCNRYNLVSGDFVLDPTEWSKNNVNVNVQFSKVEPNVILNYTGNWVISMDSYRIYKLFWSYNDMVSLSGNYDPFYISRQWSDLTNTFDNSNGNKITYGDVIEYMDNYHDTNGNYPDTNNIQIFIDNNIPNSDPTPTPTPDPDDPNGGGGSGGSGGESGGTDNIFDFLSKIGEVLGSLIKNLGNVLADLVEGIGSIISSLIESIPTVFGDFLGALLGWLPAELQALITLAITAMVIVGIIKMLKG